MTLHCDRCSVPIEYSSIEGRLYTFEFGIDVQIPDYVKTYTCPSCLDVFLSLEDSDFLEELLLPILLESQKQEVKALILPLMEKYSVEPSWMARACGTTRKHLMDVVEGRVRASMMLLRLIRVFSSAPEQFEKTLREIGQRR